VLKEKKWRNGARQPLCGNGVETQSKLIKRRQEKIMKPSTEDKAEGKLHEVKGKIKEELGKAINDPDLEVSGEAEKNAGKVQKWIGHVEKAVGK
jgi:uncharacterized protein YjbJ (UPF0337 family)